MYNKRVVIIGAGISGLSLAWYLKKKHPAMEILLKEKQNHPGGVMDSTTGAPFFFEKGPRTFQVARAPHLYELAKEMKEKILFAKPLAKFVLHKEKLKPLTMNPLKMVFSPLMRPALFALLKEKKIAKGNNEKETVYDFFSRRIGKKLTNNLVDPFALGIFAGDIKKLSMKGCFPSLCEMENQYGSLLKAMKHRKKGASKDLFTVARGMKEFAATLSSHFKIEYSYSEDNLFTEKKDPSGNINYECNIDADHVFFAIPCHEAIKVIPSFPKMESAKMVVMNFGYLKNVLPCKGFGYLVPSHAKEDVLGVVFDSEVFPAQNKHEEETRLTVMMKKGSEQTALDALNRHLGITRLPDYVLETKYSQVIPQYTLEHMEQLKNLPKIPNVTFAGNYLEGASVDACIKLSKEIAENFSF